MHILDTDTLTHLYSGRKRVVERLTMLADPDVGTTVISQIEMLRGRHEFMLKAATGTELLRAQQLLSKTEELLAQTTIYSIDDQAAAYFERLRAYKNLRKIGRADLLIASIALSNRPVLVTQNLRHFRQIPNLRLDNWVD